MNAVLLRDFYFVLPVWVPSYVVRRGRMGRVLEISGTAKNVQTAVRVAELIGEVSRREWAAPGIGHGSRFDDFVLGVIEGFRTRVETVAPARAERELATGIVYINASTIGAEVQLPFGGWRHSGSGHPEAGGRGGAVDFFSRVKVIYRDYSGRLQKAQIDK